MHLLKRLLIVLLFAALIPLCAQAQEKKRNLEVNIGVSTPGVAVISADLSSYDYYYYDSYYYEQELSSLDTEAYNSFIFPSFSMECSYKLAESGFFKRLDVVGYASLHSAFFEEIDIISGTSNKETAKKLDILIGVRYNIIKKTYFNMYTQFLLGGDVFKSTRYWDLVDDNYSGGKGITAQLTYLGFNIKLGRRESRLGAMVELGYGTEYAADYIPIIPGIRTGFSYKI